METRSRKKRKKLNRQRVLACSAIAMVILVGATVLTVRPLFVGHSFFLKKINKKQESVDVVMTALETFFDESEPHFVPEPLQDEEATPAFRVPILMYHNVVQDMPETYDGNKIQVDDFRAHMQYLAENNYKTLTLEEYDQYFTGDKQVPLHSVLITFDDGFRSMKDLVEPILQEYNLHAVSFIIGQKSETEPMWFLSKEEIAEMRSRNFFEFQSHSYDMHEWSIESRGIVETASKEDVQLDKEKLEGLIGGKVSMFCYPFGHSEQQAEANLLSAGYRYGVTVEGGIADRGMDPMQLPRVRINADTTVDSFAYKIATEE